MSKLDPSDITELCDRIATIAEDNYNTSLIKTTPRKKRGFTDKMYIFNIILVSTVLVLSFVLMFLSAFVAQIDLSPISSIVMAAFAELGLHTGFIIWKAKTENIHKYPDVKDVDYLQL